MTEWLEETFRDHPPPGDISIRMELIKGVWHASVITGYAERWEHASDLSPKTALAAAIDGALLLLDFDEDYPDFRRQNVRNEAVKFWNAVRRLNKALEGIT